jgi:hypothetical protein
MPATDAAALLDRTPSDRTVAGFTQGLSTWAKAVRLRLAIQSGRWELIAVTADDLMRADPSQLLRVLLDPARDPAAPPEARLEAYRLMLWVLEGNLANRALATNLHRKWIELSRRCV